MIEEYVLLKKYILDAPASRKQHTEALSWLNIITEHYKKQVEELQKILEENEE